MESWKGLFGDNSVAFGFRVVVLRVSNCNLASHPHSFFAGRGRKVIGRLHFYFKMHCFQTSPEAP